DGRREVGQGLPGVERAVALEVRRIDLRDGRAGRVVAAGDVDTAVEDHRGEAEERLRERSRGCPGRHAAVRVQGAHEDGADGGAAAVEAADDVEVAAAGDDRVERVGAGRCSEAAFVGQGRGGGPGGVHERAAGRRE